MYVVGIYSISESNVGEASKDVWLGIGLVSKEMW
jgi:hypothetical protein